MGHQPLTRRSLLRTAVSAGAGLSLSAPFIARAAGFPATSWPTATPSSVGLDLAGLQEAQRFAEQYGEGSGCVIRHGRLVHGWGSFRERFLVQSTTKSWGSVVLGLALDEGRLALSDRARDHLPDFGAPPAANLDTAWVERITIDQLATHTAGFPEPSRYGEFEAEPGTRWIYSNCGTNWLANVLTHRFGQDLRELTRNRLFGPMGLTDADIQWRTPAMFFTEPVHGLPATEFNGGMLANVDAMARLGLLFLRGGNWDGRQILSRTYVELATAPAYPRLPFKTNLRYGLLWWNNASGRMPDVPRDAFYTVGKNANHTIVIPSLGLVVVRIGQDGWTNYGGKLASFLQPIVDSAG
jgi:CubicO group peptidase (beta-lactamase class C family)